MKQSILIILFLSSTLMVCRSRASNDAAININALSGLINGQTIIPFNGTVDTALTPNCGVSGPATTTTAGVGTQPTTPQQPAQGGQANQNNTRFTVTTRYIMKTTGESLNMRFIYDSTQFQGPIDNQQGFVLSGGTFGNTVTGTSGTVRIANGGIDVNPNSQTSQTLSFLAINIDLRGNFTSGTSTTGGSTPTSCFTIDNVNCTAQTTNAQCFTFDNRTCATNSGSTGTPVTISGRINCSNPALLPN